MQLFSDLKYSLRLLSKAPAFTATTLVVIVLSLALYLASYSLGNMMANEPMPFPNGERYVVLRAIDTETSSNPTLLSHDMYIYTRFSETAESYTDLGAYNRSTFVLSDADYAQPFQGVSITTNLFLSLAINPVLGRNFTAEDSMTGAPRTVLISDKIWRTYYGSDPNVVGRFSRIDGESYAIAGVMPEGFYFPRGADLWLPLAAGQSLQPGEGLPLSLVGILKEDTNYSIAESELDEFMGRLASEYPVNYSNRAAAIDDYSDSYAASPFNFARILTFITLIILAIAIVNLSSLLFIRSSSRQQELAVRSSVGASGWQLSKQVLLESFLICFVGLILSLFLSTLMLKGLEASFLARGLGFNYWFNFSLNLQAVFTGIVSTLVIWLASSFLVCLKAYRSDPGVLLNSSNKGSDGKSNHVVTRMVVGFELLLSSFLLICCGALIYLFLLIANTDYGVSTDNYAVASLSLSHSDYSDQQRRLTYLEQLEGELATVPGVTAVSLTSALPQRPGRQGSYTVNDVTSRTNEQSFRQTTIWVSDNYFSTVNVDLLEGREFDGADSSESTPVTIVNENLAKRLWPDGSAIGKEIHSVIGEEIISLTVVGVVSDILQNPAVLSSATDSSSLYRPLGQQSPVDLSLLVKHSPQLVISELEANLKIAATAIDRNIPIVNVHSLQDQIAIDLQGMDIIVLMFTFFALATLALAGIGIYSVVARSIELRTYEIGIRRALGSSRFSIIWRFVRQVIYFLIVGAAIGGSLASFIITLSASSFGLNSLTFLPVIFTLSTLSLLLVIVAATYLPASKAVAMEPGDALRYE